MRRMLASLSGEEGQRFILETEQIGAEGTLQPDGEPRLFGRGAGPEQVNSAPEDQVQRHFFCAVLYEVSSIYCFSGGRLTRK